MNHLTLSGNLTLPGLEQQKLELQDVLVRGCGCGQIELNFSQVEAIDGAGLQLLLSFWHAAAEAGCGVVLLELPAIVARLLDEYDLADRFTRA